MQQMTLLGDVVSMGWSIFALCTQPYASDNREHNDKTTCGKLVDSTQICSMSPVFIPVDSHRTSATFDLMLFRVLPLHFIMSTPAAHVLKGTGIRPSKPASRHPTSAAHRPKPPSSKRVRRASKTDLDASSPSDDSGTESDELDMTIARAHEAETSDSDTGASDHSQININFEFADPQPIHYKSVRRLLEHYLPGAEATFDVSGMANAIVDQSVVGTMVQVEDDLDVYAFATILPLLQHKVTNRLSEIVAIATITASCAGGKVAPTSPRICC
jgi:hypothetical protein